MKTLFSIHYHIFNDSLVLQKSMDRTIFFKDLLDCVFVVIAVDRLMDAQTATYRLSH